MSTREEIVKRFYDQIDEDARLKKSRYGQLEYAAAMSYIRRFAGKGAKVLEIGAGTGRYSIALAKEGKDVTAVELVQSNLDVLRRNSAVLENANHLLYICRKKERTL
ncbi:MAG: SAM-dependent methyltransferase [Clostridiales bacterium]|nr:SAM-dependent methyltransferase [Clostridiales bacterium]